MRGMIFVAIAAVCEGLYALFQKLAGPLINGFLGAGIIALTAGSLSLLCIGINGWEGLNYSLRGIIFAVLIGASAFGIDACALFAFDKGVKLSIGGPLIIAGGTALMILFSAFLKEGVSLRTFVGAAVIIAGCLIMIER